MHRIPKSAQRHIDAMQKVRAETAKALAAAGERKAAASRGYAGPVPLRMDLATTPREVAAAHDVYFNGVKQTLCVFACMETGTIKRYRKGVGHSPVRGKDGNAEMETLQGDVVIVPKGQALAAR